MIADPPCIDGLIGCGEGGLTPPANHDQFGDGSGGSASSASSSVGFSSSSASGYGLFGSFSSSSSSSSSFDPFAFSSSSSRGFVPSVTDKLAVYTINNRNLTSRMLSGVQTHHGAVPIAMHFEPSQSSTFCYEQTPTILCSTVLGSGETQPLKVAYRVDSRFSCASQKDLLKPKSTLGYPAPSTQAAEILTAVDCVVVPLPASLLITSPASSSSSASGSLIGNGNSGSYVAVGNGVTGEVGGFKPVVYPQTGADRIYFAAQIDSNSGYLTTPKHEADFTVSPLLYLGIVSAALLFWVVRKNKIFG